MQLDRRSLIRAGAAAAAGGALPSSARAVGRAGSAPRQFEVTTRVVLPAGSGSAQVWVPLFQSGSAWQKVVGSTWQGTGVHILERDAEFGAALVHGRWSGAETARELTVVQRVAVWERSAADFSPPLTAAERAFWTRATPELPTGGPISRTARSIVGSLQDPRDKARAIYDWVIANTWRDPQVAGCGDGDVVAMVRDHRMGGKCVDINALMVALSRAVGIPAREVFGLRLADSRRFKSLGRSGTVTGAQHCRAEIWLDDAGWFAIDPADVRKAVLEEKLAVDGPEIRSLAEALFGGAEANWAGYNSASRLRLPGATMKTRFGFLMYVCAERDGRVVDCLDAAELAYSITSSEVSET
jgi:transglutaminase-like putative cysteine protease